MALAAASCLFATPAFAGVQVTTSSGTVNLAQNASTGIQFNGIGGNPVMVIPGLSSLLTLTYTGMTYLNNVSTFTFNYSIANQSSLSGSRVSSFGFDVNSTIATASSTGTFDYAAKGVNYPVGFGTVNVCFWDGPTGTCTGNGNGVTNGNTGNGTLTLTFNGLVNDITLSDFVDRYQGFDYQGIQSAIGVSTGVPEPGTWAIMILGFGMAGAAMRRRRHAVRLPAAA